MITALALLLLALGVTLMHAGITGTNPRDTAMAVLAPKTAPAAK